MSSTDNITLSRSSMLKAAAIRDSKRRQTGDEDDGGEASSFRSVRGDSSSQSHANSPAMERISLGRLVGLRTASASPRVALGDADPQQIGLVDLLSPRSARNGQWLEAVEKIEKAHSEHMAKRASENNESSPRTTHGTADGTAGSAVRKRKPSLIFAKGGQTAADRASSAATLFGAVAGNDLVRVKELVDAGPVDLRAEDSFGMTPLTLAIKLEHRAIVELFITYLGPKHVQFCDSFGYSPLHWASAQHDRSVLESLLDLNVLDVNGRNKDGNTPLHFLAEKNDGDTCVALANVLVFHGANVDAQNDAGETPLHKLTLNRNETARGSLLRFFIRNNAKCTLRKRTGDTPLHYAAFMSHRTMMLPLLRCGCNPGDANSEGITPMDAVRKSGSASCVELFEEWERGEHRTFDVFGEHEYGLDHVPDSVWFRIALHAGMWRTQCVCQRLRQLLLRCTQTMRIAYGCEEAILDMLLFAGARRCLLPDATARFNTVTSLSLECGDMLTEAQVLHLRRFASLDTLELYGMNTHWPALIDVLDHISAELGHLNLAYADRLDADTLATIVAACPKLHTLCLAGVKHLHATSLARIAKSVPHLVALDLRFSPALNDNNLSRLFDSKSVASRLQVLSLRGCAQVSVDVLLRVGELSALRELDVSATQANDRLLKLLSRMRTLRILVARGCTGVTLFGFRYFLSSKASARLRRLVIGAHTLTGDEEVASVLDSLEKKGCVLQCAV